MRRVFLVLMVLALCACGVKGPPLPPLDSKIAHADKLRLHARRVGGEWILWASFPSFARFTITRRGADCPEGRMILVTDGTTREVEVREAARGKQRFSVVAVTSAGERFESAIETEEKNR